MSSGAAVAVDAGSTVLLQPGAVLTVGVLAFLGGVYLESFKRRAADRRWLLEQRHDAYVAFIRAADDFDRQYLAADISQGEEPSEATGVLVQAWASVLLVGTMSAAKYGDQVIGEGNKVIAAFRTKKNVSQERRSFVTAYFDMAIALRAEVQPESVSWWTRAWRSGLGRNRRPAGISVAVQQSAAAARRGEVDR